jgi:hypothetical protein
MNAPMPIPATTTTMARTALMVRLIRVIMAVGHASLRILVG